MNVKKAIVRRIGPRWRARFAAGREAVLDAVGPARLGRLEYHLRPGLRQSWNGPFNGQERRQELAQALFRALPLRAIVETGTFRGTTTRFLAEQSGLPVYTVELDERSHAFAERNLASCARVHLTRGDSRKHLLGLAGDPVVPKSHVLFYLDAHWGSDLPLLEEIGLVFERWDASLAMIDDFEVPGTSYVYDDYGPGQALTLDYLAPLAALGLTAFFPSCPPEQETGARRGCVVLCRDDETGARLDGLPQLVRSRPQAAR